LFGGEGTRAFLRCNRFGMPFAPGARRAAASGAPAFARRAQPGVAHRGLASIGDLVVVTGVASAFPGVARIALCHGLAEKQGGFWGCGRTQDNRA
jgi:hypothetical protein